MKRPSWAAETYLKARLVVDSCLVPRLVDADMRILETKDVRPALRDSYHHATAGPKRHGSTSAVLWIKRSMRACGKMKSILQLNQILPTVRSGHMPALTGDDGKLGKLWGPLMPTAIAWCVQC